MFIFYVIALYTLLIGVTPTQYQCVQDANNVDWFIVYKLPGGKSSHYLLPTAADWTVAADIDVATQPVHSTMNLYFNSGNKDRANIVAYSNYPPHFKFQLPMSPGKGVIIAEEANKGFWLVHTAKYFPNIAGTIATLFSNEKTTKDAAAFLCMSYSDVNLRAVVLYTLQLSVTPTEFQCFQDANAVDWFFVYKLPGGKSSHYLLPTAATDWTAVADIDAAQQPIHSTMNKYFGAGNKDNANIVAYSNYPPHFKFELPMSPGKGLIIAEEQNKGFWLVHTAKYFPNLAGTIATLFSNEKTTKDAAAFLCMSYSDVNLRAVAKIIDYEQPIVFFTQRSAAAATQAFYDSSEIQRLINGLHKYQPTGSVSGDSITTLTPPGTVKIFATAPVAYSSDIYLNYAVKILQKSLQVYTPGTTTTVLRKSCAGTLKVENILGPITVRDTVIPIEQDSARWSVPKSDIDFVCLSNTGRTANDAKHGATVACILSADAAALFRSMITQQNLDACT
ncbi:Deoxyribonuclease-2-alpha [Trichinella papuae]|uniref:Deoxyribonuclease-2-alpha n=1 Tax=Trichinella papuae TaxID=268474 RepID=A0A0V1MY34_9BILA|nr:Deoxyribonuclease-2-alpha [Trichinella papuae]